MNHDPKQNQSSADEPDYTKPVAYDNEGRPLYAHPPTGTAPKHVPQHAPTQSQVPQAGEHHYVHIARPIDPAGPDIPPDIMRRYEESVKKYPHLNLSKGEFIISAVKRHPIGLYEIWGVAILLIVALAAVLAGVFTGGGVVGRDFALLGAVGLGMISFLILGGAFVAAYVYSNNRFFLTNESVIQEIQISLFNKHEQTVSLANIEDASYRQDGLLPHIFNYGTIRLSTEGDETTYRFTYVANPKQHIAVLNNAVEAFKNGRPVGPLADD